MSQHVNQERRRFRFSLRFLFVAMAAAAVGFALGVPLGEWMRPAGYGYSPDDNDFWLDWFYRGNESERESAVGVISSRARKSNPDQALVKALCDAAADDDRYVRLHVVAGLERAARTNDTARAVLQRLAADDPDSHVREMADQALSASGRL